jgi:excisionase family DNA binding protein
MGLADVSVAEAASRLGLDRSRVRQLLRSGVLAGRRLGRDWVVSAEAVADLAQRQPGYGRPPAPRRAWALIDLLDGGDAAWLDPVARSHVRATARAMAGSDAAGWQRVLRGREDRVAVAGHRASIDRFIQADNVWPAGPAVAGRIGANLVVAHAVPEVYVRSEDWDRLARQLHLRVDVAEPHLWVRVPRRLWPFGPSGPGRAALAASLLDGEWRAARAGAELLNAAAARLHL